MLILILLDTSHFHLRQNRDIEIWSKALSHLQFAIAFIKMLYIGRWDQNKATLFSGPGKIFLSYDSTLNIEADFLSEAN